MTLKDALEAKRKRHHAHPEHDLQCKVSRYLDNHPKHPLWCASAGGMRTSMGTAVKMKNSGYKKGFPDIFIYEIKCHENYFAVDIIDYYGLAIELKTESGHLSPEQKDWLEQLNNNGYKAVVCYGYQQAIKTIDEYLGA
ncbi:MAG: VRR-NUC domain-containing protein [Bacteroidetes bacterium]|nr:VRR-NUC domain-containing protein [Bacteroidota bacterium]